MRPPPLLTATLATPSSTPPPGYTGPLDINNTAVFAVSAARALSAAKRGAAVYTIRRSSDDATQSFSSDAATGAVDATAISAFVGAGNGFCPLWKDQSNSGADISASDPTVQFAWSGDAGNGLPALLGVAAGGELDSVVTVTVGQSMTFFSVSEYGGADIVVSDGTATAEAADGPGASMDLYDGANDLFADYGNSLPDEIAIWDGAIQLSASDMKRNGVAVTRSEFDQPASINSISGVVSLFLGIADDTQVLAEALLFPGVLSDADRTAIRQNIATYYGLVLS